MSIISIAYVIFIGILFLCYYLVSRRMQWEVLLAGSVFFLYRCEGLLPGIIFAGTLFVTWISAILIEKYKKRWILVISLTLIIGLWLVLKVGNFFAMHIAWLGARAGLQISLPDLSYLAPMGMSYYTLVLVGYLADVYWQVLSPEKNLFRFCSLSSFFPMFVSGPIISYREMRDNFFAHHTLSYRDPCFGVQRILWGFFKKLVIAERAAVIVNTVWGTPDEWKGLYVWLGAVIFVIQLYSDFSGCIDIVLGTAQLFGITLPENFDLPFLSQNISEFWRRWHITLGLWLKSYLLYPLLKSSLWQKLGNYTKKRFGKKTGKKIPVWCGLFCSWLFMGLWHGGGYNYIIGAGLYYWFIVVAGEALDKPIQRVRQLLCIRTDCFSWRFLCAARTSLLFVFGSICWRCYDGPGQIVTMLRSAFYEFNIWIFFDGSLLEMGLDQQDWHVLLFAVALLVLISCVRAFVKRPVREWIADQNIAFRWICWIGLFLMVVVYGKYGPGYDAAEFIYKGF